MPTPEDLVLTPEEAETIAAFRGMSESAQAYVLKLIADFKNERISLEELREILNKRD